MTMDLRREEKPHEHAVDADDDDTRPYPVAAPTVHAPPVEVRYPAGFRALGCSARLSPAETEVALLALSGHTNSQIAEKRGTSSRTVANQMASLLRKLGLSSRRELAVRYYGGELD